MNTNTSPPAGAATSPVTLRVFRPDGTSDVLELVPDKLLVIGNSSGCGLKLNGPGVAGTHCMLSLLNGRIHVRDWNSELGTFVNGQQVDHEASAPIGAEVRVGGFRLVTMYRDGSGPSPMAESTGDSNSDDTLDVDDMFAREAELHAMEDEGPTDLATEEPPASGRNLTDTWPMEFTLTEAADDDWDLPADEDVRDASGYRYEDFQEDAVSLLQAEVELLRTELAERDSRLAELDDLADFGLTPGGEVETVDSSELEALAARLEQLLAELEQSDERLLAMTELLQSAEDVNTAMTEERQQMEDWVSEIERRVSQREEEWQIEREGLKKAVNDLTRERDRAEQQVGTSQGGSKGPEEYLRKIRLENTALKARVQSLEQDREQMEQRLETSQTQSVEERISAAVEQALRAERLQITQEKAGLAREKADLARLREEVDREAQNHTRDVNSADHRIRAFREHLREIHEQEPHRKKQDSMADRLAKLWRKLDGRPLDTD